MRNLITLALAASLAACAGGPPPEVATPTPELPDSFYFEPGAAEAQDLASLLPNAALGQGVPQEIDLAAKQNGLADFEDDVVSCKSRKGLVH